MTQTKKLNYLLLAAMILMLPWVWSQQNVALECKAPISTPLSQTEIKTIIAQSAQNAHDTMSQFFPILEIADKISFAIDL